MAQRKGCAISLFSGIINGKALPFTGKEYPSTFSLDNFT